MRWIILIAVFGAIIYGIVVATQWFSSEVTRGKTEASQSIGRQLISIDMSKELEDFASKQPDADREKMLVIAKQHPMAQAHSFHSEASRHKLNDTPEERLLQARYLRFEGAAWLAAENYGEAETALHEAFRLLERADPKPKYLLRKTADLLQLACEMQKKPEEAARWAAISKENDW